MFRSYFKMTGNMVLDYILEVFGIFLIDSRVAGIM